MTSSDAITSDDIDAVIRRAELARGRNVGRRLLLLATLEKVTMAFIDLEMVRPKLAGSKIGLIFRVNHQNTLIPKSEITIPED